MLCRQGLLVTVWWTRMLCHIGLHTTTTETSSHMICHSYWELYHWQSEHECGTCMTVLRAVRDALSNTCHDRWTGRGGPTAWPSRSTPDLNPLDFYLWGHLNTLVYAAPADNAGTPHHCTVNACQTVRNFPGILYGCGGP
jgi:hypothetical protein